MVKISGIRLVVAYDSTNPHQPPELMAVPDQFYTALGRVAVQWAVMEQEVHILTSALLDANGTVEPGWLRRPFTTRWKLLMAQFEQFASKAPELLGEMKEIERLKDLAKPIRDGLSHQRILSGLDDTGPFLRFELDNKHFPWSRQYHEEDIAKAAQSASAAAGRLFRMTNIDHPTAAALPGRSLLQRLPNMDHVRSPTRQAPKPQP